MYIKGFTLGNIHPINNLNKKEYLIDITKKISNFTIEYYKDKFDPTVSYMNGGNVNIEFNKRKNACVGICKRIQRIIIYNEEKIEKLEYSELIELACHECAHLIYSGHEKNFIEYFNFLMDICIKQLREYNRS
jgi:predicted metal-dependent hydrolase